MKRRLDLEEEWDPYVAGQEVEFRRKGKGSKGAWFLAKVINAKPTVIQKKESILIEYKSIKNKKLEPLREYADVSLLRPQPPQEEIAPLFQQHQVVEAYTKNGWCIGHITDVLERSMYEVYLRSSNTMMEFGIEELRTYRDWLNGRWVPPFEEREQGTIEPKFKKGTLVEISLHDGPCIGPWFPATFVKEISNKTFVVEYHFLRLSHEAGQIEIMSHEDVHIRVTVGSLHIRPSPSQNSERRNFYLKDKVDACYHPGWWSGVIIRVLPDKRCIVLCKERSELELFKQSDLRLHMEWINGEWIQDSQETSVIRRNQGRTESPIPIGSSVLRSEIVKGPSPKSTGSSTSVEEQHDIIRPVLKGKRRKSHCGTPIVPEFSPAAFIEGYTSSSEENRKDDLECDTCGSYQSHCRTPIVPELSPVPLINGYSSSSEESENDPIVPELSPVPLINGYSSSSEESENDLDPHTSGSYQSIESRSNNVIEVQHSEVNGLYKTVWQRNQPLTPLSILMVNDLGDIDIQKRVGQNIKQKVNVLKRKRRPEDATDQSINTGVTGKELEQSGRERPKDLAFSTNLLTRDVSPENQVMQNEVICSNNLNTRGDEQNETAVQASSINATTTLFQELTISSSQWQRDEGTASHSLPFVRSSILSPLWELVESMSAFNLIQQQPHFRPLEQYNENLREGMALGCMAIFANLVEKTRTTSLDEPQSSLEVKLLALNDFQKFGFTVHPLRRRLQKLIKLKNNCTQLENNLKASENQLLEEKRKHDRLEAQIDEIQKSYIEMEKRLRSVLMEKKMNTSYVPDSERAIYKFRQSMKAVRLDFEHVAAAPW